MLLYDVRHTVVQCGLHERRPATCWKGFLGRIHCCRLGFCGWALWLGSVSLLLSSSWPRGARAPQLCVPLVLLLAAPLKSVNSVGALCGWALWLQVHIYIYSSIHKNKRPPKPTNFYNAGLCVQALSSSYPRLGRAPELCQLCGWALRLGSRPCPPLVLLLAAPLNCVNSVAGLRGWALCPGLVLLNSVNSVASCPNKCALRYSPAAGSFSRKETCKTGVGFTLEHTHTTHSTLCSKVRKMSALPPGETEAQLATW